MFGKSTFGSSSFGSTGSSLFGQNKPTTNLFGQQNTTTQSSLFGQKSTTNLFGQSTPAAGTSIFGSSNTASNTGTSLFGQSKPSLFGSSSTTGTTSLFGSSTTSTGGSLFGSSASTVNGTTVKFEPLVSSDTMMKNGSQTTIQTKHMCITAMKAYEGKSIEELRIEDYIANRKAPSSTGGLFGSSTATAGTSIFGSTPAKPSLFGSSSTSSPFGATQGTSLFSQNNNATQGSSLFGSKPTGSLFGSPSTGTSTFGSTTGGSLFGNTGTSTFGTTQPQTGSLFGGSTFGSAPTTTSSFTFGSTTNTTASPFGQTAASNTGGLFGSSTSTATTGSLFGKPAGTSTFTFGSPSNTTFGQTTSGGLFGNTQKPGGLFGSTTNTTGGSVFGSQPAQQSTGLFGSTQPAQTSLFGANTSNQQGTTTFGAAAPTTINVPAAAPIVLGSDVNQAQIQMALLDAQIAACPYGDSPLLKMGSVKDTDDTPNPISTQRQLKFLAAKSAKSSPLNTSTMNGSTGSPSLNGSLISSKSSFLPVIPPKVGDTVKSSQRRSAAIPGMDLNYTSKVAPPTLGKGIRTKAFNGSNSLTNRSLDGSLINKTVDAAIEASLANGTNMPSSGRRRNLKHLDLSMVMQVIGSRGSERDDESQGRDPDELPSTDNDAVYANAAYRSPEVDPREVVIQRDEARNRSLPRLQLDGSACEESMTASSKSSAAQGTTVTSSSTSSETARSPVRVVTSSTSQPIVRINSPDYFTEPTINAMREMVVDGKVVLTNGLTVGRATYGSVFWPGRIELENVVLDEIVIFRHKEVTVYPDESKKPPLGEGLNRPAEVTLERVWHIDRATKEEIRDPLKLIDLGWRDRLEKVTARMGATFKDYRPSTGSWVFRVEHFSKYGLPDDEDDTDVAVVPKVRNAATHPADISAHDMDTSLEEHHIQSYVQRAKVPRVELHTVGDEGNQEITIETGVNVLPSRHVTSEVKVKGLGGRMDMDYDDDAMYDDYDIANWRDEVPEKKPKMEEILDYVYEESKRLMELSTVSPRPVRRLTLTRKEPLNVFRGGVEASKTVGYKKSTMINAACAHGSTSRVSWSQNGQFAFSLQPVSNEVQICTLQFDSNVPKQLIIDMLEHNVRLSRTIRRNASTSARVRHCEIEGQPSASRVKPAEDSAPQLLDSFLATATQSECAIEQKVWRLCQALFPSDKSGEWLLQRASNVGEWLREEVATLPQKKAAGGGTLVSQVWTLMCAGDSEEAMKVATDGGMITLSLMISATVSNEEIGRCDCANMLEMWEEVGEMGTMEDDLLKIYLVLAGKTHTEFQRKGKTVHLNCLEGLDWRQAFGIHLWWVNCGGFLEDAVDSFTEDVTAGRAASPDSHVFDQLIRLACSPSHQIEAVLDSASMLSSNPLDAHLSWHIWSLLRALGYNTMSPAAEQRLHISYSSLLTSMEQWHLAIFVLSHISHDQCRTAAIREVLDRMSLTAHPQDYERISAICEIPIEWIASSKLSKAKAQGNYEQACSYALTAGDYAAALQLFSEEVAPYAIAMGDLHKLRPLAERMEKAADKITGWGAVGQIYADYCVLKTMDDDEDTEENDEKLQELVDSIFTRIQAPVFKTPIQRLCMRTMARELFEIKRLTGQTDYNLPLSASQLARLIH
ncbi:Nucleoporin autopeptidase [Trichostrongylus colubriformis]|uniref:Nuclear pore complex protein Nup98-Nup96 n=1 Tax=Trichostrongylus colubriformis TaxID=6319 RepID=A0AAN8G529_TRICO